MFSPAYSRSLGQAASFASAYRSVGVETSLADASPHKLIEMLFDGYMEALKQAQGYLASGQVELKGRALSKAARIVDEGLKASLNLKDGGRLAQDLHDLYAYLTLRLTLANVRNDPSVIAECERLMQPLCEAWKAIGPQVNAGRLN
ncbi:flagellar export chaperone FliS [Ideonella dechloratans]|uniref:Flagellar secretion chaperone FliS n=1 Tax=Ideonella dechloratans TaxID=36863 RepID=A0A643F6R2_IDEDE|nr:flagellar export chaperone FliS [Ideonella dechloratans]KAB0573830.1 flagellar export chaperone FliS [Ideonella dechloratans]UFU09233.1 flagellar export chaperone FliS [Ideonella dechloratans]